MARADIDPITESEAARIASDRSEQELLRARIKVRRLMDLLHDNAIGRAFLSASQIKSIEIMLDRAMPRGQAGAGGSGFKLHVHMDKPGAPARVNGDSQPVDSMDSQRGAGGPQDGARDQ